MLRRFAFEKAPVHLRLVHTLEVLSKEGYHPKDSDNNVPPSRWNNSVTDGGYGGGEVLVLSGVSGRFADRVHALVSAVAMRLKS